MAVKAIRVSRANTNVKRYVRGGKTTEHTRRTFKLGSGMVIVRIGGTDIILSEAMAREACTRDNRVQIIQRG